jgi:hypothetical protein
MLKREIAYEDFNGNQVTDIFYFNISKPELIELEVEYDQGFGAMIQGIIDAKDNKSLIKRFKEIVLMAYGQKSEDGKRFVKSDKLREEFAQTAAYGALFMELATNDNAAVTFLKSVLPKDMVGAFDTAASAPSPPTPITPTPNN